MTEKKGDYWIQLKAKDEWINQLLIAHEYMRKEMIENGLFVPDHVKFADEPPGEKHEKIMEMD